MAKWSSWLSLDGGFNESQPVSLLFLTVSLCPLWVFSSAGDCSYTGYAENVGVQIIQHSCSKPVMSESKFLGQWHGPWWTWHQDRLWTCSYGYAKEPPLVAMDNFTIFHIYRWFYHDQHPFLGDFLSCLPLCHWLTSPTVSGHMGVLWLSYPVKKWAVRKSYWHKIGTKNLQQPRTIYFSVQKYWGLTVANWVGIRQKVLVSPICQEPSEPDTKRGSKEVQRGKVATLLMYIYIYIVISYIYISVYICLSKLLMKLTMYMCSMSSFYRFSECHLII